MLKSKNPKLQKLWIRRILSVIFVCVTLIGSLGAGAMFIVAEAVYPQIYSLFSCPAWLQSVLYVSLAVALGGIIGCAFFKDSRNTVKAEGNIFLIILFVGLVCMTGFAFAPETYLNSIFIGIGGALCSVGFFCGACALIGTLKRDKRREFVYVDIYYDVLYEGKLTNATYFSDNGAPLSRILKVEKYFGTVIPDELTDFLLESDGDGELLFSARKIIETAQSVRETFKDTANYCFFGGDGAGNYYCYRINEGGEIESGAIYFWNHEGNEITPAASSLPELIYKYYDVFDV